jgi:hypothetical protein
MNRGFFPTYQGIVYIILEKVLFCTLARYFWFLYVNIESLLKYGSRQALKNKGTEISVCNYYYKCARDKFCIRPSSRFGMKC